MVQENFKLKNQKKKEITKHGQNFLNVIFFIKKNLKKKKRDDPLSLPGISMRNYPNM